VNPDTNGPDCNLAGGRGGWRGFNPGDGGPNYTGCSYGREFYRTLMHVQLGPYLRNKQVFYCPSDKLRSASPSNMSNGLQSYQWFPNWIWNHRGSGFPMIRYATGGDANGRIDLTDDIPSERSDRVSDRMLLIERGAFGWDGPDARNGAGNPAPNANFNHSRGYNAMYFDGHAKTIPYGKKWTTIPATGWPQAIAPR